jgi:hypothetical protein
MLRLQTAGIPTKALELSRCIDVILPTYVEAFQLGKETADLLLFIFAQFLKSQIGAQWIPEWIEP